MFVNKKNWSCSGMVASVALVYYYILPTIQKVRSFCGYRRQRLWLDLIHYYYHIHSSSTTSTSSRQYHELGPSCNFTLSFLKSHTRWEKCSVGCPFSAYVTAVLSRKACFRSLRFVSADCGRHSIVSPSSSVSFSPSNSIRCSPKPSY